MSTPNLEEIIKTGITSTDISNIFELLNTEPVCSIIYPPGIDISVIPRVISNEGGCIFVVESSEVDVGNSASKFLPLDKIGTQNSFYNYKLSKIFNENIKKIKSTSIVFCTQEFMRNLFVKLIKYGIIFGFNTLDLSFCDILMLNQIQLGTVDLEVIMTLWKYAAKSGAKVPRLLLSSYTLNIGSTPFPLSKFYLVKITGFPVEIQYHSRDFTNGSKDLYLALVEVILQKHKTLKIENNNIWLVFCPASEVEFIVTKLKKTSKLTVSSYIEDLDKSITNRKIIIITDPTIISTDNCSGVFDCMEENIRCESSSGGLRSQLENISKSTAEQRAARTGRNCPGFVYRLCTNKFYDNLEQDHALEISRIPIHSVLLETYGIGLNPIDLYSSQICYEKLSNSIELLQSLEMIINLKGSEISITPLAEFSFGFPLSIRGITCLYKWIKTQMPIFPAICMVSIIDCFNPSYFYYPRSDKKTNPQKYQQILNEQYQKYFMKYNSNTDVGALLNMLIQLFEHFKTYNISIDQLKEYSKNNNLNNRKIVELITVIKQVIERCMELKYTIQLGPFSAENVVELYLPIFKEVYSDQIYYLLPSKNKNIYTNRLSRVQYFLDKRQPISNQTNENTEIIGLLTYSFENSSGQKINTISLSLPVVFPEKIQKKIQNDNMIPLVIPDEDLELPEW